MTTPAADGDDYPAAANFEHTAAGTHAGVVLLHGLGGDLSQPRDYTRGIIDGRPVSPLVAGARLHGLTRGATPEPVTFDVRRSDITALADVLGFPAERVWVGVSMGAATALRVALQSGA